MSSPSYQVRLATLSDARAAAEVHCASAVSAFAGIFPPEAEVPTPKLVMPDWEQTIADPESTIFVGLVGETIVGTGGISPDPDVPTGMVLARFYVRPDHWQNGLGARLYARSIESAISRGLSELNLWVLEDNPQSRGMYERLDWRLVPDRYRFVGDTKVRDVLYHRQIDGSS